MENEIASNTVAYLPSPVCNRAEFISVPSHTVAFRIEDDEALVALPHSKWLPPWRYYRDKSSTVVDHDAAPRLPVCRVRPPPFQFFIRGGFLCPRVLKVPFFPASSLSSSSNGS